MRDKHQDGYQKRCIDCKATKAAIDFHSNSTSSDGLSCYCKPCALERRRASELRKRVAEGGPPPRGTVRRAAAPPGQKWCPQCAKFLPLADFPRNRSQPDGVGGYCKLCHNSRGQASKEKLYGGSRHYHLKRRYGVSAEQVNAMIEAQGGLCAICRRKPAEQVDHSHATGVVREILCFNCNGGLGQFGDDPLVLAAAADYLRRHRTPDSHARDRLARLGVQAVCPPAVRAGFRQVRKGVWRLAA